MEKTNSTIILLCVYFKLFLIKMAERKCKMETFNTLGKYNKTMIFTTSLDLIVK